MNLLEALKSREGTVVLVDNDFAPIKVEDADGKDRTSFYRCLRGDAEARHRVAELVGAESGSTVDAIMAEVDRRLGELWERYISNPESFPDLAILFLAVKANYDAHRDKLHVLAKFCESTLGVKPVIHHDLAQAKGSLSACMIAFVDFYLKAGVNNFRGAIEEHAQYGDAYRSGFIHDEASWPKVVFLVSSKLPPLEQLQTFREVTGIRSAFFTGIRKGDVSLEALQELVEPWRINYGPNAQLYRYLNALSDGVTQAAAALSQEINRLELHDLRMLDVLRLSAESESLQSYLTWLLSEALASKLRSTNALQTALLPDVKDMPHLDGKMLAQSVLFELFADIAVSPSSDQTSSPEFGDIYEIVSAVGGRGQELLLAISPACDLARCSKDDPVLCVKGVITKAEASLSSLLGRKALYGKGNHVVRFRGTDRPSYAHIEWTLKKGLITLSVGDLIDPARFRKIARLSEIFTQEIKELVLSEVSRVGIPVEPTFAVAGNVNVRAMFSVQNKAALELNVDLKDEPFISAILTKGRTKPEDGNTEIIVFTQQFSSWLLGTFLPQLLKDGSIPAKGKTVVDALRARTEWHVPLGSNRAFSECSGLLRFKVIDSQIELPNIERDGLEILVTTMGA